MGQGTTLGIPAGGTPARTPPWTSRTGKAAGSPCHDGMTIVAKDMNRFTHRHLRWEFMAPPLFTTTERMLQSAHSPKGVYRAEKRRCRGSESLLSAPQPLCARFPVGPCICLVIPETGAKRATEDYCGFSNRAQRTSERNQTRNPCCLAGCKFQVVEVTTEPLMVVVLSPARTLPTLSSARAATVQIANVASVATMAFTFLTLTICRPITRAIQALAW